MADSKQHDLAIIGAGPGGYVAALRAAQLGMDVACIDKEDALGGTCLRIGCIPSKALLESSLLYRQAQHDFKQHGITAGELGVDLRAMMRRKDTAVRALTKGVAGLFRKNKVSFYHGAARFEEPRRIAVEGGSEPAEIAADNVIIATGSRSATLPGIEFDGDRVGTSTEALAYPEVPEHLVVVGAGAIGLELGSVWARLGAKVTVLEYLDRILPGMDAELAAEAEKIFRKQGLEFRLGVRVTGARADGDGAVVEVADDSPVRCDRVLVAVGRVPQTEGLGLERIGIEPDGRGFIHVDEHFSTSVEGVYAIGDVVPGPMLAHKASEEGIACVEYLATGYGHVNYDAVPNVVYTEPEIASVGRTEGQLQREGVDYRKGSFPFIAIGRARAMGHTDGRVKVLAEAHSDRLLGVHILGSRAGDLIAEAAVAIEFGASAEDLARSCHAHPTLAEALKEAALAVDRRALHI
jgi:dihydrolipoamide dehydrogenase